MDSILTRCDFVTFQVCDVVDRVLKSPNAEILKELHPVSLGCLCDNLWCGSICGYRWTNLSLIVNDKETKKGGCWLAPTVIMKNSSPKELSVDCQGKQSVTCW